MPNIERCTKRKGIPFLPPPAREANDHRNQERLNHILGSIGVDLSQPDLEGSPATNTQAKADRSRLSINQNKAPRLFCGVIASHEVHSQNVC